MWANRKIQMALGIWTLLAQVPVPLGLAHQAGALLVLVAALWHLDRTVSVPWPDRDRLPPKPLTLGVALVHTVEVGGEQRGLVAPGPGTNLHDRVAIVVRIARHEQRLQLGGQRLDLGREPGQIRARQRDKLGIRLVGELPSLSQLVLQATQPIGQADDRRQPGVLPTQRLQLRAVPCDRRVGQEPLDLRRPLECLAEPSLHGLRLSGGSRLRLVLPPKPVDAARSVYQALAAGKEGMALRTDFHVDGRGGRAGHGRPGARPVGR